MEETYIGYRFLLLAFIIVLNAVFASAEMALVSARKSRLKELADGGAVGAQAALNLLSRPERLLSTVQVGVTLAGLGAGWAGEETLFQALMSAFQPILTPQTSALLHAVSFIVAFLVLTFLMVVLGEVVPKNFGIKQSERYAMLIAPVLLVVYRIAEPFVYVLERSSGMVSRVLGLGSSDSAAGHSAEELKLIASSVRAAGEITQMEEEALGRMLELSGLAVREVMVPRNDIVCLAVDAPFEQVLRVFAESGYSRVPVYEGEKQNIIGILHVKDLLPYWQRIRAAARFGAPVPTLHLRSLLHKHAVAPETKPLSQMLDEFRHSRVHLAMVVDEFGTISGLVTMEDVLEQVLGEIEDEHDPNRPRPSREQAVLELEGTVSIRDLETQYGIELPGNAGFQTVAGFLLFRLGYIPKAGDAIEHEGRRYTIAAMENKRIARVKVERL